MIELSQVLYGLFLAGAVYGGIRADLKGIHQRITDCAEATKEAHKRIDVILNKGGKPL